MFSRAVESVFKLGSLLKAIFIAVSFGANSVKPCKFELSVSNSVSLSVVLKMGTGMLLRLPTMLVSAKLGLVTVVSKFAGMSMMLLMTYMRTFS